ncbi:MAG TPA: hypothetical protein VG649_14565 [Candidatus Angelobacter sp.]|jgi:hypothetical protein|nr:hypothetical protein [Candidatus Angelobacter sp.]
MGSTFVLWMIIILVFVAIAMFMLKKNHAEPEPVIPMHNDGGHALNLLPDKSSYFTAS